MRGSRLLLGCLVLLAAGVPAAVVADVGARTDATEAAGPRVAVVLAGGCAGDAETLSADDTVRKAYLGY